MPEAPCVTAFCPGHISGYFKRVTGPDAERTGSIGAGIVISEGVTARVREAKKTTIQILRHDLSGKKPVTIAQDSPVLRSAIDAVSVTGLVITECHLPLGAGFGLSAAALLAMLTALNHLYDLGMSESHIAHLAHETEIRHSTGLGDVASCRGGGLVIRKYAGIDAPVRRYLDIPEPVYAVSFGPIPTPSVLGFPAQMDRIAAAFPADEPDEILGFFSRSRAFAEQSGLITPQVKKVLRLCDRAGVPASMTMLGNGVFAYGREAGEALEGSGEVFAMNISERGPVITGGS